jgi:hypothetical protein
MRRRLNTVLTGCLLLGLIAPWAHAEIINGQYVPPGLNVGDQYRLVFITSGVIDGNSMDPNDYDAFLTDQVAGTALEGAAYGWSAVVSTYGAGRLASGVVNVHPGVPVYNTGGLKVADDGAAMLDTTVGLINAVQFDQNGVDKGAVHVWTGSNSQGGAKLFWHSSLAQWVEATLGSPGFVMPPSDPIAGIGAGASDGNAWLDYTVIFRNPALPGGGTLPYMAAIYGISDVLTVPIPEPATCVMWLMLSAIGGVVFWRRRRNSS